MSRHRVDDRPAMRRALDGSWMLVRPDRSVVHLPLKKDTRIIRRLLQEAMEEANLKMTYRRWPEVISIHNGRTIIPDPDREPGEWSPFSDDGTIDDARLRAEGWHHTGALKDKK